MDKPVTFDHATREAARVLNKAEKAIAEERDSLNYVAGAWLQLAKIISDRDAALHFMK